MNPDRQSRKFALAVSLALLGLASASCSARARVSVTTPDIPRPNVGLTVSVATTPEGKPYAEIQGDRIVIARPIYYDTAKHEIRPESFPVIDAVAQVVKSHPEITALLVEGHTDAQGGLDYNRKLSEERADAVVVALVARGVTTPTRIAGYGTTNPTCLSNDDACLQLNRRVEFRIERK